MHYLLALAALAPAVLAQTHYGCYTDVPAGALVGGTGVLVNYTTMTITECETHCTGFDLWAVEYGGECTCGNTLAQGSFPTFSTDCAMPCPGDAQVICGGPNRLSVYGTAVDPPAVTPFPHDPVPTAYEYEGCWTEVSGVRALAGATGFSATDMTTDGCGEYCLNSGFLWFGLEYMAECFCGEALNVNSTLAVEADCAMPCSGAPEEVCGGSDRLSVYQWV